ncbi:MAG: hypothetical protein AB8I08_04430 [Sandaracinaceae bacterium]
MRTHVLLIAVGLLSGAGMGGAALAHALSCASVSATATLELTSVTVDGQQAVLETAPPQASFFQAPSDPEDGTLLDANRLQLGDALTGTSVYMDYTP